MAGFNRTLSPQGDGNLADAMPSRYSPYVSEFNRTLSPQGDGNCNELVDDWCWVFGLKFNRTLSPQGDGNHEAEDSLRFSPYT